MVERYAPSNYNEYKYLYLCYIGNKQTTQFHYFIIMYHYVRQHETALCFIEYMRVKHIYILLLLIIIMKYTLVSVWMMPHLIPTFPPSYVQLVRTYSPHRFSILKKLYT